MIYTVGIFVFDQVEVLDFAGPYEVFTTAARVQQRLDPAAENLFTVFTVGRTGTAVRARAGLLVWMKAQSLHLPAFRRGLI